jgi:hypothetical protein
MMEFSQTGFRLARIFHDGGGAARRGPNNHRRQGLLLLEVDIARSGC